MLKVRGKKTHSFLQSSEIFHPISSKNWEVLESCNANFELLRKYLRRFQYFVGVFSNFVGGNFCFVGVKNKEIGQNIAQMWNFLAFLGLKSHIHRIFSQKYRFSPHFLSP